MKEPEDLGIKIGTPIQVKWKDLKKAQEEVILNSEINIDVVNILIKRADEILKE